MGKYLVIGSYTAEGAKGLLKEGGTSRRAETERLVTALGGKLEAYYFGFGKDDFYVLVDMPDNVSAAAAPLIVGATGSVRVRTIVLQTPEEVDAVMAKAAAVSFRAAGQ
jgi:uncharacterized protein with GYD domain